jgi:hypothetical protein
LKDAWRRKLWEDGVEELDARMPTKGTLHDIDAQRARWLRYRTSQRLTIEAGEDFAVGGLGGLVDGLDLRLAFLPEDPDADGVPLDSDTLDWLREPRPTPYGGPPPQWGNQGRPTSTALVMYDQYRDDAGWVRFLALHRHGGIELGRGNFAYQVRGTRVFPLRQIVGLGWIAAALQSDVADRWRLNSPFELTVALRNTSGATLGSFAEGWAEPGTGFWDFTTCIEDQILLRWEVDEGIDPERLALALGDRLEQAFGSTRRRHLAHRGDYEGRFDPRFEF